MAAKGRVSKEKLAEVMDGANTLVDELRSQNEEYALCHGEPSAISDQSYDELRFELMWQFLRTCRS